MRRIKFRLAMRLTSSTLMQESAVSKHIPDFCNTAYDSKWMCRVFIVAHCHFTRAFPLLRDLGMMAQFAVTALVLGGCSTYPIPDDVLRIDTEDIVRHARCEMRTAIIDSIIQERVAPVSTEEDVIAFVKDTQSKIKSLEKINKGRDPRRRLDISNQLTKSQLGVQRYMGVAAVYSFDFNITENNTASADVAFKLPFTGPGVFDLGADSTLNLTRQGQRQFKAADNWAQLIIQPQKCQDIWPRRRNIIYPFDGSIGVGRVVETFIDIANQGGAKDSFVDTLIFTTQVGAGVDAAVKLDPVPASFRLVSASAKIDASRLDVHKVIISLVFPRSDTPDAISGVDFFDGYLNAPFDRPADWRARYNLCVADAREREDTFKKLRESAPEVYCIEYADAFAPQYGTEAQPAVAAKRREKVFAPSAPGTLRPNY